MYLLEVDRHMWMYVHTDVSGFFAKIRISDKELWNMKQIIK